MSIFGFCVLSVFTVLVCWYLTGSLLSGVMGWLSLLVIEVLVYLCAPPTGHEEEEAEEAEKEREARDARDAQYEKDADEREAKEAKEAREHEDNERTDR